MSYSPTLSLDLHLQKTGVLLYLPSRECARFALKTATAPVSCLRQPFWGRKQYTPQQPEIIKSHRKRLSD